MSTIEAMSDAEFRAHVKLQLDRVKQLAADCAELTGAKPEAVEAELLKTLLRLGLRI
jgi:hypothetical protein